MVASEPARRVAVNTAAQLVGKAIVLAVGAVSIVVLTRYLGPADYGRYGLALSVMQLFGVAADAGVTTIVVREISRDPSRTRELVGNALTLRLALSVAILAATGIGSLVVVDEPDLRLALLVAGSTLVFGGLSSAVTAVCQARLQMGRAAVADVVGRLVAFAATVTVVLADLGFLAAVGAAGIGAAVTFAVVWRLTAPLASLRPALSRSAWRELLAAGVPVGLTLALNELYVRADTLIISASRSFEEVGLYALAYRILELGSVVGTALLTSLFPLLSREATGDPARLRAMLQHSWDAFLILAVPFAVCGSVLATHVAELAGGEQFARAAIPLRLLLISGGIAFVSGVLGFALIATDRQRIAMWLSATALTVNVVANIVLVPRYGIQVAAAITIATEVLALGGGLWFVRRAVGFTPDRKLLLPTSVAATIAAALVVALPTEEIWLLGPVAVLAYAGALLALSARSRRLVGSVIAR